MRLTPPRPPGEDYYLACASFSSKAPVDGFWTYSKCFTGSWLGINRLLRWFSPARVDVRVYQGKEQIRLVLAELRRQTALHGLSRKPGRRRIPSPSVMSEALVSQRRVAEIIGCKCSPSFTRQLNQ
jgi:hypothetical protein